MPDRDITGERFRHRGTGHVATVIAWHLPGHPFRYGKVALVGDMQNDRTRREWTVSWDRFQAKWEAVEEKEIDTLRTDMPVCPHCGLVKSIPHTRGDISEAICDACGKSFYIDRIVKISYMTYTKEQ